MIRTLIYNKKNKFLASNINVKNCFRFFCNKKNLNENAKLELTEVTNQDDPIVKPNVNNDIQNKVIDNQVKKLNHNDKSKVDNMNADTEFDFDAEFNKIISDNERLTQETSGTVEEMPNMFDYKNENCLYSLIKINLSPEINNLFVKYYIHKILPKASKKDVKPKIFEFDDSLNFFDVQDWEYNEQFKDEKTKAETTKKMKLSIRQIVLKAFEYSIIKFYSQCFKLNSDLYNKNPNAYCPRNQETFSLLFVTNFVTALKDSTTNQSIRLSDKFKLGLIFYPITESDNNKETIKNKNFSFFLFIKYYKHTLNKTKDETLTKVLFENYKTNDAPFLNNNLIQQITLMSCTFWNYAINKLFTLLPITDKTNNNENSNTSLSTMKEALFNKKTLMIEIGKIVSRFFRDDKIYAIFEGFLSNNSSNPTDFTKQTANAYVDLYNRTLSLNENFNKLMKMAIKNKHVYLEPCTPFVYNGLDSFFDNLKDLPGFRNSKIIKQELQSESFENAFKLEFKRLKAFDQFKRNLIKYEKPREFKNTNKKKDIPKPSSKKSVNKSKKNDNIEPFQ